MNPTTSFFRTVPIVAFLLLAPPGRAEETAAPPLAFTAALQRAAENNPTLAAQRYGERAAEALIEQAGVRPNPTLDVALENFLGTGRVQGVRGLEATVQANQILERGGKREKRIALAGRERDTVARQSAVRRREVLAATAMAYIETVVAQQRLALAEAPLQLARATLAAVDGRVQAGAASPAESARARVAVVGAQAEYARRQTALALARAALAAMWGGEPAAIGSVHGGIRVPDAMPAEATFLAALANHPQLELQQAYIAMRRAALDLEQSRTTSDVTVGGGVRFLREGTDATFVAGVSVPIPLRNPNPGNLRAARETLAGAEHAARALESELRIAFAATWQQLQAAHAAAHALRRDALPATTEAHAIVRRAYEQGELPLIDVLDAQRALGEIHREIFDAESAYVVALARVEGLTTATFPATAALLSSE